MAYTLISSVTIGAGGAANIAFTGIPATYTDLLLVTSLRTTDTATTRADCQIAFNNGGSSSWRGMYTDRGAAPSTNSSTQTGSFYWNMGATANDATTNTFANTQLYLANYTSTGLKTASSESVCETNSSSGSITLIANSFNNSAATTSLTITSAYGGNFVQYSTASLYGIK